MSNHLYNFFNRPAVKLLIEQNYFYEAYELWCSHVRHVNSLNFFTRNDVSIGDFGYALEKAGVDYFPYIGKELPRDFFIDSDLAAIVIPPPIEKICDDAFYGCGKLRSVSLPYTLISIELSAFNYCVKLQNISFPDSINVIGSSAFANCNSLTSIVLPKHLAEISKHVFWYCESLSSVVIPQSVIAIGEEAFCGCKSLKEITFLGTKNQWRLIKKGPRWKEKTQIQVIHCSDGDIIR